MKIGDEVVCINSGGWVDQSGRPMPVGPKFNEVCLIRGIRFKSNDQPYLYLKNYESGAYNAKCFAQIASSEDIKKLMIDVVQIED